MIKTEPRRVPELDGVRGLAITMVMLWHYLFPICSPWSMTACSSWLWPLCRVLGVAWTGVDLFFTLSGFLIGGIILDRRPEEPRLSFLRRFYLRRSCRIFPLY